VCPAFAHQQYRGTDAEKSRGFGAPARTKSRPHATIVRERIDKEGLEKGAARKYGAGLGWQYCCVLDLERAFEASIAEQKSIPSWD
jgi:hypothetical protein